MAEASGVIGETSGAVVQAVPGTGELDARALLGQNRRVSHLPRVVKFVPLGQICLDEGLERNRGVCPRLEL